MRGSRGVRNLTPTKLKYRSLLNSHRKLTENTLPRRKISGSMQVQTEVSAKRVCGDGKVVLYILRATLLK